MEDPAEEHSHLPRLADDAYAGFAFVHWNFAMRKRKRRWLDASFHGIFREMLLHALCRYQALCPVYCLMPDHAHLLILGWSWECRQRNLVRFLRKHTNHALEKRGCRWQKQPYDNVLRDKDRARDAFQRVAWYIAENPVRAGLVEDQPDWPHTGAMIPGYPDLRFGTDDYWDRFWKTYASQLPDDYWPVYRTRP